MDASEILCLVLFIIAIVIFVAALYFKHKGNIFGVISELIAFAEGTGLTGPEKMNMVIDNLFDRVPSMFQSLLTKEVLRTIAQYIFDCMKKYAMLRAKHEEDPIE